jgi:probable F420-dependent oxidoreductase
MKIDAALHAVDDLSSIADIAASAEARGFDAVWATEVQHDPFIQLALAATATERIRLGTAIALSFTRSPMALAYTCWDLAALSRGRFILGLGTQVKAHNVRRFSVPWGPPVPRLREVLLGLRAIWECWREGTRLDFRGEHYSFTLMTPFFTPPRHSYPIPVWIAGVNTGLCRLAGELADGFHIHPLNSPAYIRQVALPAIEEGASRAGRGRDDIELSASVFVVTGETPEQTGLLREMVRQQISFYASTPSYRVIFETHGWRGIAEELSALASRKRWNEMPALINDDILETFAVVAPLEDVLAKTHERYEGLLDRVTFYLPYTPNGPFESLWTAVLNR